CPIFVLPILSLGFSRRGLPPMRRWLLPAVVIASFVLFIRCDAAWTGGYGVGPRFLIPALPFLFIFAAPAQRRWPRIATVLIAVSVAMMFAVTAVRTQYPTNTFGPPIPDDPVAESIKRLTMRQIARTPDSFNLGLLMGMKGLWSLIPPALVIAGTFAWAAALRQNRSG